MAFVFDSTAGSPTANSYLSVEDADALAAGLINGSDWLSLTEQQKQALLVQATTRLDAEVYGGVPTTTVNTSVTPHQALQWPRNWIIDKNYASGELILSNGGLMYLDPNKIPAALEKATFYQAMHYYNEFMDNPTVSRQDMDRLTALSIGPLTMTIQKRAEERLPDMVKRLLVSIGSNAWDGAAPIKLVR